MRLLLPLHFTRVCPFTSLTQEVYSVVMYLFVRPSSIVLPWDPCMAKIRRNMEKGRFYHLMYSLVAGGPLQ